MRKIDPFFVVVLILFCGLATSYVAFDYHLSGLALEKSKNKILEKKIAELSVVVNSLEQKSSHRSIASVGPVKNIQLDGLYKEQLRTARAEKDAKKVSELAQKIISSSTESETLAEAYFAKAEISCATYVIKENSCLADIEVLISQFPDSVWAGEGLIVLSSVYTKQKRFKEASSLIKIVKTEFSSEKKLQTKAEQLEKSFL